MRKVTLAMFLNKLVKNKWWFFSYSTIVLLSVLINLQGYYVAIRMLNEEVFKVNMKTLEYTKQKYDSYISELLNISYSIVQSNAVEQLAAKSAIFNNRRTEYVRTIQKEITGYTISNQVFENAYVIIPEIEQCISAYGISSLDIAYAMTFKQYYQSREEWIEKIFLHKSSRFVVLDDKNGDHALFACWSLTNIGKPPSAVVMVQVDGTELNSMLNNMETVEGESFHIVDESGECIFSSNNMNGLSLPLSDSSGSFESKINGQTHLVSYISSDEYNLKYVRLLPKRIYLKDIMKVRWIFYVCFILCIVFGGILVYVFSKINTRNKEKIEAKLNRNKEYVKENLLRQMLSGTLGVERSNIAFLTEQGMMLTGKYLMVILFDIASASDVDTEIEIESADEHTENHSNVEFDVVCDAFSKTLLSDETVHFCKVQHMCACVLNFFDDEVTPSSVGLRIKSLQQQLNEAMNIKFICAISQRIDDISQLKVAFGQAMEIINFVFIEKDESIFVYDDFDIVNNICNQYQYDLNMEKRLMNLLMIGNKEGAIQLIDEVFEYNRANMNLNTLRIITSDIVNTFLKTLSYIDPNDKLKFKNIYLFSVSINNIRQIDETKKMIINYASEICDGNIDRAKGKYDTRCIKIQEYIKQNYKDSDLNVSSVAERFGLSANWISKYFKEQVGENMVDYIVNYRLQIAKELLLEDNKTIKQISDETGFLSANTFFRAFKRWEGISPKQYREQTIKEDI